MTFNQSYQTTEDTELADLKFTQQFEAISKHYRAPRTITPYEQAKTLETQHLWYDVLTKTVPILSTVGGLFAAGRNESLVPAILGTGIGLASYIGGKVYAHQTLKKARAASGLEEKV